MVAPRGPDGRAVVRTEAVSPSCAPASNEEELEFGLARIAALEAALRPLAAVDVDGETSHMAALPGPLTREDVLRARAALAGGGARGA